MCTVCCWQGLCVPIAGTFTHEVWLFRDPCSKNGGLCDREASHIVCGRRGYVYNGPWSYLGPWGALEYIEIFSCFGALGSIIQPPSSSSQEVHVIKQRQAFCGLQAVGNQVCQDSYDSCLSLRTSKLEIWTQNPLHAYPSGVLSKDGSNSCPGPMPYHWTLPSIHDSML